MKKLKKMAFCAASGEPGPEDALQAIRQAGQEFQTCIASLEDILEEPLKTKFTQVKAQINKMLAGLPETDKVSAALGANDVLRHLLGVLSTAQVMISSLQETAKANASTMASTKAALPGEITSAIDAKIKAGELLTKEDHDQKVADAAAAATTAARTAALTETRVIGERRQILATASLPVPADEVLTGEEADFTAKKDAAAKRAAELKPFNLPAERVLALCWNTDEAAYQERYQDLKKVFETAGKPGGANPFAKRDDPAASPKKAPVGLC